MLHLKNNTIIYATKEMGRLISEEPPATPNRIVIRTAIMGYELGDIQQFTIRNLSDDLDQNIKDGYEENTKLGMADLLTQCAALCIDLGWDFDDLRRQGIKHLQERHKDFEKEGYGEE